MNYFMLTAGAAGGFGGYTSIILMVAMLGVMWFLLIRPQKKKDKQQREMRNSIEVGDGITTIGGIVGRVVSIKDETVVIETGSDRTKVRFQKWAIQDVEKLKLDEPAAPAAKDSAKDADKDSDKTSAKAEK
ncbi:MAG: preprotein translocase subunit YajC [Oscillospiraceae bacterium]